MNRILNIKTSRVLVFATAVVATSFSFAQENGPGVQAEPDGVAVEAMMLTSQAFRNAEARVKPWLVTIESFGGVSTVAGKIGGIRNQGEGNTTGIMISPDGYILTSTFNFVQQPPIITVITGDGKRHIAHLQGRDETRKLCLLKIEDIDAMPVPETMDPDELKVGQWALSVGVGYGDEETAISIGIISATNRIAGRAVQTDANISPANYGGPLIDIEGRLIGVCVPMNPQSQAIGAGVEWYDSGIGFAVPLHGLDDLIERLKKGETIEPAFLGVQASASPDGDGLLITEVVPESAAATGGLSINDVILSLDGKPTSDLLELRKILSRFESGDEVEITFIDFPAPEPPGPDEEPDEADESDSDSNEDEEPSAKVPNSDDVDSDHDDEQHSNENQQKGESNADDESQIDEAAESAAEPEPEGEVESDSDAGPEPETGSDETAEGIERTVSVQLGAPPKQEPDGPQIEAPIIR